MKALLVTSGEPAGVGPDVCLALASTQRPIVVLADKAVLAARAQQLGIPITLQDYQPGVPPISAPNTLTVLSLPCDAEVQAGVLNPLNAPYVIQMLTVAADRCAMGEFSAIVTAPVHKAVINQAGIAFTGHTEFFATYFNVPRVVMMLACPLMKVALVTTHLPLRQVADAVTVPLLMEVITLLQRALQQDFGVPHPRLHVAGLNPHAGEGGYLGLEELEVIIPALEQLQQEGIDVQGPIPADTMFTSEQLGACDACVMMYHDQGLPVLKYADFERAVNVTLGLPIVRTSVDHGTALALAGTGLAEASSLLAAVEMAADIAARRAR